MTPAGTAQRPSHWWNGQRQQRSCSNCSLRASLPAQMRDQTQCEDHAQLQQQNVPETRTLLQEGATSALAIWFLGGGNC